MVQKDIDVCGIGNSLLDILIEVTDADIERIGINKGEMTLTDSVEQMRIIKSLEGFPAHKAGGGSAANSMVALAQFGAKVSFNGTLGNDDHGRFYAEDFKKQNLHLHTPYIDEEPTGTCLVLITPDSERTMMTSLGASALFSKGHVSKDLITRSKWLYIEGYELTQINSAEAVSHAIQIAKENDTKVAVSFSDVFITEIFKENLQKIVRLSDFVFCNEAEALNYSKSDNLESAYDIISKDCSKFAITKGSKGSTIKWDEESYEIPPYPADSIDSTGAGDMFAGAFMYGLIYTNSIEKAGKLASLSASKIVSQFGARFKGSTEELLSIIQ